MREAGRPWWPAVGRPWARLVTVLLGWTLLSAHVGTNQVVFEGRAGGYPVRVFINPPGVVPAQVPILVRVLDGTPDRVLVRAAQWNVGLAGSPPPDTASRVRGDATAWSQALWLMTASSYAVHVTVEGAAGSGSVVVPLQTRATRVMGMERALGALLLVLGGALVWGALAIVRAGAREGSIPPGATPRPEAPGRGRRAVTVAAVVLVALLAGGSAWWRAEAQAYRRRLDRPLAADVRLRAMDATRVLTVALSDARWLRSDGGDLVPDHGKLLHLFLVDAGGRRTLAHLHPLRTAADRFETAVPPLPAGRYLLYGELLQESGAQYALLDTVDVPVAPAVVEASGSATPGVPALDPDDAWMVEGTPAPAGGTVPLAGGAVVRLHAEGARPGSAPQASSEARLVAEVREADGAPATLLPYMGMDGHALVVRADAGVFMHLHPAGMASLAAQAQLRESGNPSASASPVASTHAAHEGMPMGAIPAAPGTVGFPVAFPSAGTYRVFVQLRRGGPARGAVETAAFDVTVER